MPSPHQPVSLKPLLTLVFLASIGTGVIWNGIPFIAERSYGFSARDNLLLYIGIGITYVGGAFLAGPLLRRVADRVAPRTILAAILVLQGLLCLLPRVVDAPWMIWVVGCGSSILFSWLWPVIESYLTSARHGAAMRSAIGWFNITWTAATGLGLALMGPLMDHDPRWAIVILGALNFVAAICLMWFPITPAPHHGDGAPPVVPSEYRALLHAARVLLPLSYVLNAAMSPLMPYIFESLDVAATYGPPATATWMAARVVVMAIMWRAPFWHGRWGTLLVGFLAMAGGFALVVGTPSITLVLIGLAIFGAGLGIIYYAALYYAMTVGHAAVDAGGAHEGLIGLGYTVGPMAALFGMEIARYDATATAPQTWIIIVTLALIAGGAIGAVLPYLRARSRR